MVRVGVAALAAALALSRAARLGLDDGESLATDEEEASGPSVASLAELPTKVRCADVKHLKCSSPDEIVHLHGNSVTQACKKDYKGLALFGQLANKVAQESEDCDGDTKMSANRWKVTFADKRRRCCLCPLGSIWSSFTQQCICPTTGRMPLPATGGKCPTSHDDTVREEARQNIRKQQTKTAKTSKDGTSRQDFNPDVARELRFEREPAKQEIVLNSEWCKVHRDIDELAPPASAIWRLAPVRLGMGFPVPALGFLNGLGIEELRILKLDADLVLENTPQGMRLSIAPDRRSGETIRVGLDGLTLWVDGQETRIRQKDFQSGSNEFDNKFLLQLGGSLEGSDLLADIVRFRSSVNIEFKQTFWRMGKMKSNSSTIGLVGKMGNTNLVEGQAKALVEWWVSDILSKKLFAVLATNLGSLTADALTVAGIDSMPMRISIRTKETLPEGADPSLLHLELGIRQGTLRNGKTELLPGFAVPTSSGEFHTEGDTIKFNLTAHSALDTRKMLKDQATEWNLAVFEQAGDPEGQSYKQLLTEMASPSPAPPQEGQGRVRVGTCAAKRAQEKEEQQGWFSSAGSAVWGWMTGSSIDPNAPTTIPVDPSDARAKMEAYLYSLWEAQKPNKIGLMSRVAQTGDPYYSIYGCEDVRFALGGNLRATVTSKGVAELTGQLSITNFFLVGLATDYIYPKPCHATERCSASQNLWAASTAGSYIHDIGLKTPLAVDIRTSIRGEDVDTCASLAGEVKLQDDTWVKTFANKAAAWFNIKKHVEDTIESSLHGIIKTVFAQFHEKGLQGFDLELRLDSTREISVKVNGRASYSALGDLQALAAAVPPETPAAVEVGKGWASIRDALRAAPGARDVPRAKLSLSPADWLRRGWVFAVNDLLSSFSLHFTTNPSRSQSLLDATGGLSLDIPALIRAFSNDNGAWDMGQHAAAVDKVQLREHKVMVKDKWLEWEAVLSCGALYFVAPRTKGTPFTLANRADEDFTVDLTGLGEGSLAAMPANFKHPCQRPGDVGFLARGKKESFPLCVPGGSPLARGIAYEQRRAEEVQRLLASRDYTSSTAWTADGALAATTAFDWESQGLPAGRCSEELGRCAGHFPCQGVALKDGVCEFLSMKEVASLGARAKFARKRWQVGPPQTWGAAPAPR